MLEKQGNIWDQSGYVGIPTNGESKANGEAVMGAGLALQASNRYPGFSSQLGKYLKERGNTVMIWPSYRLVTVPTKDHWKDPSSLDIVERSCRELMAYDPYLPDSMKIYLPHLGCGLGGLNWVDVRPVMSSLLNDRFIVVSQ